MCPSYWHLNSQAPLGEKNTLSAPLDATPPLPWTGKGVVFSNNPWLDPHPLLVVLLQSPASKHKGLGDLAGGN